MRKKRIIVAVLLFLLAIPVGLEFVIYDVPFSFKQLKRMRGFWMSWAASSFITFVGMALLEGITRLLDRHWSWKANWISRLLLQVGAGVLLPLAVVVSWNAGFFYRQGATLNLEHYLESEFWLVLILLIVFNAVCSLVLELWKAKGDHAGVDARNDSGTGDGEAVETPAASLARKAGIDVPDLIVNGAYIEVSGRTCIVYRFDGGKEVYAVTMDNMEMILQSMGFCRIHRKHILNRKIIMDVEKNLAKHACTVFLEEPFAGQSLNVGPKYLRMFLKWLEL